MKPFTLDAAQCAAIAARHNALCKPDFHIGAESAYLLFGDNADSDLADNGQHLVEIHRQETLSGNPETFYILQADVTLADSENSVSDPKPVSVDALRQLARDAESALRKSQDTERKADKARARARQAEIAAGVVCHDALGKRYTAESNRCGAYARLHLALGGNPDAEFCDVVRIVENDLAANAAPDSDTPEIAKLRKAAEIAGKVYQDATAHESDIQNAYENAQLETGKAQAAMTAAYDALVNAERDSEDSDCEDSD